MSEDPFVRWIQATATAMSRAEAAERGIKQLGDLMHVLSTLPDDCPVVTDEEGFPSILEFTTYRGYYERIGIVTHGSVHPDPPVEESCLWGEPSEPFTYRDYTYTSGWDMVVVAQPSTVKSMSKACEVVNGAELEGYKGGAFLMGTDTYLHVAPEGSTGLAVVDFDLNEGHGLVIVTGEY